MDLFPMPILGPSGIAGGSLIPVPSDCLHCDRSCTEVRIDEIRSCKYGYAVHRVDDDHLLVGLVVRGFNPTPATKKVGRNASNDQRVTRSQVDRACEALQSHRASIEVATAARHNEALRTVGNEASWEDLLGQVKSDLNQVAGQLHDFRSLALQIRQNIESHLDIESEDPTHLRSILEDTEHQIVATYWASRVMTSKLDGVRLLADQSIMAASPTVSSRLHGLVHKYRQIYEHACRDKGVSICLTGESWGQTSGPALALEQIPLVLIDNAYKYAPTNSSVTCSLNETNDEIEFTVTSLGPKIEPNEVGRIFQPGYRARAAQRRETGLGLGLALLRLCCETLNAEWGVTQDTTEDSSASYETCFTVTFDRCR